jgi:nitroreductase
VNVIEAIQARRSVKHFDASHRMSEETIQGLLGLAMLSPTAFNLQHWRFVVVRDPSLRSAIRAGAWDQAQMTDASLLIALCVDLNAWSVDASQYWTHAPKDVQNLMAKSIDGYYRGKPIVQRDEAMRSCGLAAQTLMLAATSLGYESCPIVGFDFEEVGRLINLPEDHVLSMFVAIGKATQAPWPRGSLLRQERTVVVDRFPPKP